MSDNKKPARIQDLEAALREIGRNSLIHHDDRRSFVCKYCDATCHEDNLITLRHKDACPVRIAHKALNKDS